MFTWTRHQRANARWCAIAAAAALSTSGLAPSAKAAPITVSFQQGVGGYAGALDTYVHEDQPFTFFGSSGKLLSDGDDDLGAAETPNQVVQSLIRFDHIFDTIAGSRGQGPIPDGSTIVSAVLSVRTGPTAGDESLAGNLFSLHRMIVTWGNSASWDGFGGNGVDRDGVEAATTVTASNDGGGAASLGGVVSFDVTADVQLWSNNVGLSTRGWLIHPTTGTDGWNIHSSEATSASDRPLLTVTYVPEPGTLALLSLGLAGLAATRRGGVRA